MARLNTLLVYFLFIAVVIFTAGCSEDNPNDPGSDKARIYGKVDNNGMAKTSGSAASEVKLVKIESDGSFSAVNQSAVQTDAQGNFVIETEVTGRGYAVTSVNGSGELKAVIADELYPGRDVYVQPLTMESTAEAEIYAEMTAGSNSSDLYADVAVYVDEETAEGYQNNKERFATIIRESSEAEHKAFMSINGSSEVKWNQVKAAKSKAVVELDRTKYNASSSTEVDAAHDAFHIAIGNTYKDNGFTLEDYSKVKAAALRLLIMTSADVSAETQFNFRRNLYLLMAKTSGIGVRSALETLDPDPVKLRTVIDAEAALEADIKASQSLAELQAAYDQYRNKIVEALKIYLSIYSDLIVEINQDIVPFRTTFMNQLSATLSSTALVNALNELYTAIINLIESKLSSAGNAEVQAAAAVFILLNLNY